MISTSDHYMRLKDDTRQVALLSTVKRQQPLIDMRHADQQHKLGIAIANASSAAKGTPPADPNHQAQSTYGPHLPVHSLR